MTDINKYAVRSGRIIAEDGTTHNIVDLLGSGDPVSEQQVHDIRKYAALSGRVIGEDGMIYNLVDLLRNIGGGGGNGEAGPVNWSEVQNKPATYPPSAHDHDDRYYTKSEIDSDLNAIANSAYKVQVSDEDTPDYLVNKLDSATLTVENNEIRVKGMDGLTLTPSQVNALLTGADGNIQGQINDITMTLAALSAGMKYLGKFETKADLEGVGNKDNGDLAVVLADETRSGARSMYVYNDSLGIWDFIGAFEFADTFTALSDTPSGYNDGKVLRSSASGLFYDNVRWAEIANKPSSTAAQIDAAVGKAHGHNKTEAEITNAVELRHIHSNLESLEKLSVDENNELLINGVVYKPKIEKEYCFVRRITSDLTIAANSDLIFNSIVDKNITYYTSTGLFYLKAGKTYRVTFTASINTPSWIKASMVYAEGSDKNAMPTESPNTAIWTSLNSSNNEASCGPLDLIITPSTSRFFKIHCTGAGTGSHTLRGGYSALLIQEI